jgi:hypothetical protein
VDADGILLERAYGKRLPSPIRLNLIGGRRAAGCLASRTRGELSMIRVAIRLLRWHAGQSAKKQRDDH